MKYVSEGPEETKKIAAAVAKKLSKAPGGKAIVIALEGELGAGKTTFAKGFAKALGIKQKITSPTFVLIKKYQLTVNSPDPTGSRVLDSGEAGYRENQLTGKFLYHIDAYRLKDHRELAALGVKEIMGDPRNIVLIEWADRVRKALPKNRVKIHIDHLNQNSRRIIISGVY